MNPRCHRAWLAFLALALAVSGFAAETNSAADADAAYARTITQRADKIVATLNLTDSAQATRVRDIITRQYRDLNTIHAARDAQIKFAKEKSGPDKAAADMAVQTARDDAKPKLDKLHSEFLARLSTEFSTQQVDQVKDAMTYGVVPLTYGVYLKMYPDLTNEAKQQIMAWLLEAREIAMDGSTSDEKHAVFGRFKGKINNFLSKAGYDARKGEQNLKKAAQSKPGTKAN